MTKEEAKHLSDVLKAYSEGKEIEHLITDGVWDSICKDPTFTEGPMNYRIKPEPKYRPYKNIEEFLKAEKEHGPRIRTNYGLRTIAVVVEDTFLWNNPKKNEEPIYEPMAKLIKFKWQDGTPCGIVEE